MSICVNYALGMIVFCRIAALIHWKNSVGPLGTYRNLLKILAKGNWHDSAQEVINFINSMLNTFTASEEIALGG